MNFKIAPCYKCEKRKPGCHDGCDEYIEWSKAKTERGDLIRSEVAKNADANSYQVQAIHRMKTRKAGGK